MAPTQEQIDNALETLRKELESPEMVAAVHGTQDFNDMFDAFDYCRQKNQPVIVFVDGEKWKLYPSGAAKSLA